MFDKLRLKLTLLCSLITIAILWTMTALFWISSVDSQRQNICASFQNDMNALLANLESQDTISHAWLKKMQNRSYSIYLTDSGSPYVLSLIHIFPPPAPRLKSPAACAPHKHSFCRFPYRPPLPERTGNSFPTDNPP